MIGTRKVQAVASVGEGKEVRTFLTNPLPVTFEPPTFTDLLGRQGEVFALPPPRRPVKLNAP